MLERMAGFNVMEMLNGNSIKEVGVKEWYQETNYEDAKEIIRDELGNIRNSFIKVGYFLRRIQETEGYKEDGYESIWECAKDQFGITRTTASRWMEINKRFSSGGCSPYLAEEYKGYNKSQLQEMLYLSEEKLEEVNPGMKVMEIREQGKNEHIESAESHIEEQLPGQMNVEDFIENSGDLDDQDMDEKSEEIQRLVEKEYDRQQDGEVPDLGQQDQKEKASIREQKTANIIDTMTDEEDQDNARKIHILKMLEKYYIYLNEEEIQILSGMLQDCKRRKQEYALEDCGETE